MATLEGLTIDGLALNDGVTYSIQGLDMTPPPKRPEWVTGGDSDGGVLGRDPLYENRVITARIRIIRQATMDLALAAIAALSDKLEEAERNQGGVSVVWAPTNATTSITFKCLSGEITELPIVQSGQDVGWFFRFPVLTVKLTCLPFGYGTEVTGTPASSTLPLMTVELASVTGDVPAEGRLIVTDAATQSRRHVEWGLESRFYPTSSPPSLIVDSDSLVTSGYSGTGNTRTGAYDPGAAGNSVVRVTLPRDAPIAVCGTGDLGHVGTFRVKARVYAVSSLAEDVKVRFVWQEGDGPFRANPFTAPPIVNGFAELDLGTISVPEKTLGTQRWSGRIEAYTTGSALTDTLDVDVLYLMPAGEGYGVARGEYAYQAGVITHADGFGNATPASLLNARTADTGGTWATSGVASDFTAVVSAPGSLLTMSRNTDSEVANRYAIVGSATPTNQDVSVALLFGGTALGGVIGRWTDANNHVRAAISHPSSLTGFQLIMVVAGVTTQLSSTLAFPFTFGEWYKVRLVAFASGRVIAILATQAGATLAILEGHLGASLTSGKPGFFDQGYSVFTHSRYYDDFRVNTPPAEPFALYSTRMLEVRSDAAIRADSTGTFWGPAPSYRGTRFYVPPAGTRNRKTRVAVKARRNDVTSSVDDQIADNLTVQANYTPRYLVVPR